jgi:endoglucanase
VKYAKEHKLPVYLGEFGAFEKADLASRVLWTRAMVREMEARGFSWAYWEFCAGFGVYDRAKGEFRQELLGALTGK